LVPFKIVLSDRLGLLFVLDLVECLS